MDDRNLELEAKFDEWWEENYMNISADRTEAFEIYSLGIKHQQAKVEELQTLYTQQGINMLKMQKRVDAVKGLAQTLWEKSNEKHKQGKVWESKALGECADEILDVLEQALKGEGQ